MRQRNVGPRHPGRILDEDYLQPRGLTQTALAHHLGLDPSELSRLTSGLRRMSAELAWIIGPALGTPARLWLEYQLEYDLWHARPERLVGRVDAAKRRARGARRARTAG